MATAPLSAGAVSRDYVEVETSLGPRCCRFSIFAGCPRATSAKRCRRGSGCGRRCGGVADFYVARKHPTDGRARHDWATRTLWPAWFACHDVHLSPDHLPLLQSRFKTVRLVEGRARLRYLPFRAPYYTFIGRKPG